MKSILLSLVMLLNSGLYVENETFPSDFYGIWQSVDNEFVRIQTTFDFEVRFIRVKNGQELAGGTLTPKSGRIHVSRTDIDTEYTLSYIINNRTMIVEKPDSHRVWVFTKVGK